MLSFGILLALSFTNYLDSIRFISYLFAYFLAGAEILYTAIRNILRGKVFDENFLMALASLAAFIVGEETEAVAVLIFYGVGELLQGLAVARSRRNIEELMDIRPDIAHLKTENGIKTLSPEEINIADILIVRPGERVPLDGEVIDGESFLDLRALTGESVPVRVEKGSNALSGAVNQSGLLEIRVTKQFSESTVSKILKLVQEASNKKAKSEKFITKFARYYTPIIVIAAIPVAFVPPLLGLGTLNEWVYRSLSLLIISCPCALVLSIPVSFFGGLGGAARHGVLIKGSNYLDTLNSIDTLVVDKTGTLTKGIFKVKEVKAIDLKEDELLAYAARAEFHSSHPIAKSIIQAYKGEITAPVNVTELSGKGIIAKLEDCTIHIGNKHLMEEIQISQLPDFTETTAYIAKDNKYIGYIIIADEIKENARNALDSIREEGVNKIIMLTGDKQAISKEIASNLGIDDVRYELLPHEKVDEFEKIMATSNSKLAFVGDGINDAPVLSRADIGFAMGGIGSDAAIEAADIVIMNDSIEKIAVAFKVAKKTRRIAFENIVFALGVKAVVMVLAVLGITNIWFAIFADVGVALIAIMNAMRAMFIK